MYVVALVLAAILFIWGVLRLIRGRVILGIVLIICSFLVGPGGYSILR